MIIIKNEEATALVGLQRHRKDNYWKLETNARIFSGAVVPLE
jgi:hypothetical protein